jgi:hypothetical protein
MTVGSPPSITATTELVVPKSIPTILAIYILLTLATSGKSTRDVAPSLLPDFRPSYGYVIRAQALCHSAEGAHCTKLPLRWK